MVAEHGLMCGSCHALRMRRLAACSRRLPGLRKSLVAYTQRSCQAVVPSSV